MLNGKRILGIIPARGGSKGVPRKNIQLVAGRPLIAWTIEEAKKSQYLDRLILSSDDSEIIEMSLGLGVEVPFVRPPELAQDETPGVAPILHALKQIPGFDYVVLLQPTSPLRICEDIDRCIEICLEHRASSCVSVTVPDKSPYLMYTKENQVIRPVFEAKPNTRRQDMPKVFALNGAVFVADIKWLHEKKAFIGEGTMAYEMPKHRSVDIDDELDLKVAEIYLLLKN